MNNNYFIRNPQLEGDSFFWEGSQTGILLIHGFTATTAEVRLMAEKLKEEGFTISAPLLPGHGTHPDDLNNARWPMWVESVKTAYEQLLDKCDRIYVIGESMGALLALELAAQHPEVAGICLFAPAIKVKHLWLSWLLAPFKKYLKKSDKDDGLAWKGYNVYPVRSMVELFKLQMHTRQRLFLIDHPTFVFTGEYDRSIAPDAAQVVLDGIRANPKCHIHMEKSDHCILLDKELDLAYQYVTAFIKNSQLMQ